MEDSDGRGAETLVPAARLLLRSLDHRIALLALEIAESGARLPRLALVLGITASACVLTGLAATLLVAAIFWDTPYRIVALALLCGLYLAAGALALYRLCRGWRTWQPLAATRTTLLEDLRWLRRLLDE